MKKAMGVLLFFCSVTAQARLGESLIQCDHRYNVGGQNVVSNRIGFRLLVLIDEIYTVNTVATNITYRYDGWSIVIGYLNNIAVAMEYSRLDQKPLDDAQCELILKANSQGLIWNRGTPSTRTNTDSRIENFSLPFVPIPTWIRADGATGYRTILSLSVRIESKAFQRFRQAIAEEKERKKPKPGNNL